MDNSGFAKGTLVKTDKGRVPIQGIKVGDMVLSTPEDDTGEVSYQPVTKTFVHDNKALWMLTLEKYIHSDDMHGNEIEDLVYKSTIGGNLLTTPNHPIRVVGSGKAKKGLVHDIDFYKKPCWKLVDELEQYDIVVNADGVLSHVNNVQSIYQFAEENHCINHNYYWYASAYHQSDIKVLEDIYYGQDVDYDHPEYGNPDEFEDESTPAEKAKKFAGAMAEGWVRDINHYYENGFLGVYRI